MAHEIHNFDNISVVAAGVNIEVDMSRLAQNYNQAQFALDSAIMTSMEPFMPHQTGSFINVTKAMSASLAGSGTVVAAAPPMGRFLYEGNAMVGEKSRSAWAKRGERKVLSGKLLTYSRGGARWFDKAKSKDLKSWNDIVKEKVGAK